ncbi:MAG: CDGSH iron-sulfur domain-containing protein [Polyangiales bacterium]
MRRPPTPEGRVWITHPDAEDLVDLSNAVYTFALRLLCQGFSAAGSVDVKRVAIDAAVDAMSALDGLATALTRLPAREEGGEVTAGVSFALLRSIAALPDWPSQWTFLAERAGQLREGATKLSRLDPRVERAASTLARVESALRERVAPPATVSAATTAREPAPAVTESAPSPDVEEAHADGVTLRFEGRRCIHARRCVLSEPRVFLANVKGPWLHPEAVSVERVARVAQACPSGAITYLRRDGGPNEEAPEVNTAAVRENGPLALHADLRIAGEAPRFRATLCRCGRSQKKPFCDGAHAQGFEASGEPPTRESAALEARGGLLEVTPMKDGPLDVRGSLELCSGTGRTILRTARTRLCRCGGSSNKPYCDGTHARIGFRASRARSTRRRGAATASVTTSGDSSCGSARPPRSA